MKSSIVLELLEQNRIEELKAKLRVQAEKSRDDEQ